MDTNKKIGLQITLEIIDACTPDAGFSLLASRLSTDKSAAVAMRRKSATGECEILYHDGYTLRTLETALDRYQADKLLNRYADLYAK